MPSPGLDVDHHHTRFLQCCEMFGHAGVARADSRDDVAAGCRPAGGKEPEDLVARSVAESRDGSLDVGRPGCVVRLRNSRHSAILPEEIRKSKNSTLDDTLSIFDNKFHSFY